VPTRLQIAKKDIINAFENGGLRIFRLKDIQRLLEENRGFWRLAQSTSRNAFIDFLLKNTPLTKVRLAFPSRPEILYVWGNESALKIATALHPQAYLCHYTAIFIHQLTEQIPKIVYVNIEQTPKPTPAGITSQEAVDRAFKGNPRETNNVAEYDNLKICVISGKSTGRLGVTNLNYENQPVPCTDLERTLLDAVVRPFYNGGVFEVLNYFRKAKGTLSVNRLASYLKKINYVYPYQQSIGFYLERAGYSDSQIGIIEDMRTSWDFYLGYRLQDPDYSQRWKLYYPKGI